MKRLILVFFCLFNLIGGHSFAKQAGEISIIDISGQEVVLPQVAQKVVLGEGRFLAALSVLGITDPIDKIAGMMNEFRTYDPTTYAVYAKEFPQINTIPTFGHTSEDSVSVEKILLLDPDLAIFGLDGHGPGARSHHIIEKLKHAGIPVMFIDFRQDPIKNTPTSIEILGKAFGVEQEANKFAKYYRSQIGLIESRVANIPITNRPKVLLDLRVDNSQPCCFTVAEGLFASMAELAGGRNIANEVLESHVGQISLEYVMTTNFDIYIGTAYGSPNDYKKGLYDRIIAGVSVEKKQAQESLLQTLQVRGLSSIEPVKNNTAYGLWHHFYNSPLNLYAIQKMAKWFHPSIFDDLNPDETLKHLLSGFKPLDLSGIYAMSLKDK